MKTKELRNIVEKMNPLDAIVFLENFDNNIKFSKLKEKLINESNRLKFMLKFEEQVYDRGIKYTAGIDEAGRGPLAGPVVAAAVILPENYMIYGINDSKKISEKRRNILFDIIKRDAIAYSVQVVECYEIDTINILRATKKAMLLCIQRLSVKPGYILVDALRIEGTDIKQASIIHGDERSLSIASASILAKVTRDAIMYEYDKIYPEYGFRRNKGYGTKEHITAIKKYGPIKIHRSTFIKNIV